MSQAELKRFKEDLENKKLVTGKTEEELKSLVKDFPALVAFAKENGYDVSPADFQVDVAEVSELDDDELKAVAGGQISIEEYLNCWFDQPKCLSFLGDDKLQRGR